MNSFVFNIEGVVGVTVAAITVAGTTTTVVVSTIVSATTAAAAVTTTVLTGTILAAAFINPDTTSDYCAICANHVACGDTGVSKNNIFIII